MSILIMRDINTTEVTFVYTGRVSVESQICRIDRRSSLIITRFVAVKIHLPKW